jgi:DNA (cytosine-5)-methyltransferase 1
VVIENVDDFTYMALDIVQTDLESEGYAVQAFVLPACATGAPHIRERCFVVAYSNRLGESREACSLPNGQRSATLSTSLCQWQDRASNVADAEHRRCQWRSLDEEQSSTTLLCGSSATRDKPQSRMGRVFDGISARLDRMRWPYEPGPIQYEWEPARTVTGRQPSRRKRLEALGNAIVPQQIYPIFQCIVTWERGQA